MYAPRFILRIIAIIFFGTLPFQSACTDNFFSRLVTTISDAYTKVMPEDPETRFFAVAGGIAASGLISWAGYFNYKVQKQNEFIKNINATSPATDAKKYRHVLDPNSFVKAMNTSLKHNNFALFDELISMAPKFECDIIEWAYQDA